MSSIVSRNLLIVGGALLLTKFYVAVHLPLFGDEAFYWQCAQRLAVAYVDLPPLTALLVWSGTSIFGDSTLGVRIPFLLLGACLPIVVSRLALPLVGARDAVWAGGIVLAVPGLAALGLFALPDVPLILLAAAFLGMSERAIRTNRWTVWALAGGVAGLGFLTHYRFGLAPLSVALFLMATSRGRRLLRGRGPWVALVCGLPGLVPALIANLQTDSTPLGYFLAGRHGTTFDPAALLEHLAAQLLLIGPPLYVVMLIVLVACFRRARAGDEQAALMFSFAALHLGVYFLASPLEDSNLATAHWPLAGYVALVPFVPRYLREMAARRRVWATVIPLVGVAILAICMLELSTGLLKLRSIQRPFTGWQEAADRTRKYLDERSVVIADNYKLGANLEFQLGGDVAVYILDHPLNAAHGRAAQFDRWGMGESALSLLEGQRALFVYEYTLTSSSDRPAWEAHIASLFGPLETLPELLVDRVGERGPFKLKVFRYQVGTVRSAVHRRDDSAR